MTDVFDFESGKKTLPIQDALIEAYNRKISGGEPLSLQRLVEHIVTTVLNARTLDDEERTAWRMKLNEEIDQYVVSAWNPDSSKGRQLSPVAFAAEFAAIFEKHHLTLPERITMP